MYYLKHKTKGFMPQSKGAFTWQEPTLDGAPRIFLNEKTAKRCLNVWASGTRHRKDSSNTLIHTRVPDRSINEWEVRRILLT